ncbi:MAG TPA: iron-containing redox enzyme family protein [Solirubrobacterales bacterium]
MTAAATPEARWIDWLGSCADSRRALRAFCPHYFYFSYCQIIAFSGLFTKVDPLDRQSLAELGDVLHEELGRGQESRVHSRLFERFAAAVGLTPDDLRIDPTDVLPGVSRYVAELERAFGEGSRAQALAAYVFLETSAVDTYGPLVQVLISLGYSAEDVEFFELHAGVEPEHAAAAEAMLQRHGVAPEDPEARAETEKLAELWRAFWSEIDQLCRNAVS